MVELAKIKDSLSGQSLQGRKVLVAGGTGLIGTSMTQTLLHLESHVRSTYFSNTPTTHPEIYEQRDFTSFTDCMEATKGVQDLIICAAQIFGAQMMKENPTGALLPNLQINAGLIEAAARNQVERVIFISSSTVYQEANYPIAESDLDLNQKPFKLYQGVGTLNRYIESLIQFYHDTNRFKAGIVRPTAVYGPNDQFADGKSHIIPANIKRALGNEDPYVVWGDGTPVRDFVYVGDVVESVLHVLTRHCHAEAINVGSGSPITIAEAVKTILEVCKSNPTITYDPSKPSSLPFRAVSTQRHDELFPEITRTSFHHGIEKTVQWYQASL